MGRSLSRPKSGRIRDFRGLSRKVDARYDNRTYLRGPDRCNADLPACLLIYRRNFLSTTNLLNNFPSKRNIAVSFSRLSASSVSKSDKIGSTDVPQTCDGRIVPSAFTDKRKIHYKSSPKWDTVSRDPNPVEYAIFADYPEKSTPDTTTAHISKNLTVVTRTFHPVR
jgi:hypothetical protein